MFSGASKEHLLNEVILQHLYRQGQLGISETLAQVKVGLRRISGSPDTRPFVISGCPDIRPGKLYIVYPFFKT